MEHASIGPYRVVERLGAGGMGEVYLAVDTRLNRRVALKYLSDPSLDVPHARERLLREARAAAKITHRNIAAIYDILDTGTPPCIVMEYAAGETLASVAARGPLPCERVLEIGAQLADALAHAHAAGVIHRDLKPANIVLAADGNVKVLDFGLARVREVEKEWANPDVPTREAIESRTGDFAGTPAYMSPEQLVGRPATPLSDIYSLGVTLYELLTGRLPFDGPTTPDLVYEVLSKPTPSASAANGAVPPLLNTVVARAMARKPGDRYQSAAQLGEELSQAAADRGSRAGRLSSRERPTAAARAPAFFPWRRVLYAVGVLVVAVGLLASAYSLWGRKTAAPTGSFEYVAVLPFTASAADHDATVAAAAISEVFTSALEGLSSITLVSKNDTKEYLGKSADANKSARELGAVTVSGTVIRAGSALRFSVRLEQPDGKVLSAKSYQGNAAAMAGLEAQAVSQVVSALNVSLTNADRLRLQRVPACRSDAMADYASARALLDREDVPGNAAKAESTFGQAIAKDPNCALAFAGLADAYWALYRATKDPSWVARADQAIQRASSLDSGSRAIRKSEAAFYGNTGRNDAAEKTLRAVIEQWPNDDEAHRLLSGVLDDQGRSIEAATELQQAINLRPTNWINYLVQGNRRYDSQHFAEAVESYRRVLALQPDNVWAITNLGATYWKQGERDQAIAVYRAAPVLDDAILGNMGMFYLDMGQYEKAVDALRQAVTLTPNSDIKHGNLGDAYTRLGRMKEALEQYRLAADRSSDRLAVNPANALVLARHAVYDAKLGRPEAVQHATEAVRLSPDDATVLYKRAVVHCLLKQPQEATDWLRRAIEKKYPRELARADADLDLIKNRPEVVAMLRGDR